MPDRRYKAGPRRDDLNKPDAQMSPGRWAWLKCNLGQLVIMVNPTMKSPDVKLIHPFPRGRGVTFNLTALTEQELDAFESLVRTAIDWARPIVRERDKDAEQAFANGDDSMPRVYRQVPQLVFRKGHEPAHWAELRQRPEGSADVAPAPNDPNAGLGKDGSRVSQRDEVGDGEQDNGA